VGLVSRRVDLANRHQLRAAQIKRLRLRAKPEFL
jgi:hypothetical protein